MRKLIYCIYKKWFKLHCRLHRSCKGCIGDRDKRAKICELALLEGRLAAWADVNSYGGD